MAKMPSYEELTAGKAKNKGSGSMPSYDDVMASRGYEYRTRVTNQRNHINSLLDIEKKTTDRINNWITGDRKEDISSDIEAYERALEALKRYGKDTKAASEWIAGVRADNNAVVRQNLIDDIGEAKDSRKGTLWDFAKATVSNIGATSRGDTATASKAQQEAIAALNRRSTSKQQQRDAEAALAAHREQYGNVLTAGERLEQAYKDEDEAIRSLAAIRNSNRPGSSSKSRQAEAEKKLEEAQKTIIELGGTIDASAARGAVKSYVGSAGAGVAYGLKGQDTRKQDSNIRAGEEALAAALEDAILAEAAGKGSPAETARLRSMVDAINQPGADKATILAEFLPGIAEVTDEVALRDRRADLQRQALGNKGYAAFKELYESGNAELEAAKVGKSEAEKVLIDVAVQGGNMAADAAIGIVTGGAATPMALRTYGAGVIAAESAGASQKDAMLYGIASAGVELLSEKLFDGLAGVYGGGKADEAVDYFIGKMAKTKTGRAAWNLLFSAGGESVEELISGIADPILTSIYNDRGVFENLSETEAADVLYDMLIGGIMGFLGGSVEGLTKRQDDASKFFQTAAEKGLTYKQASQIWAETSEVNVERDVAEIMGKAESAALKAENEAKRKEAAEKAEQAEFEYYEKLTHRAQANKVLDNDERMAEFQKRTGIELKGGKGDQARAVMAAAAEKVQEIDQKRDQRRKDAEAARAKAAVAELDTGDVTLNEKGETVVDGKVVDMSVKETLQKMGFSEARAEDIAKQYDPNTATKGEFAKAMRSTYLMARAAVPEGEINAFVDKATPQQRQIAAAYGDADRVNAAKAAQEAVKAKVGDTVVRGEGGIINDTGRSIDLDTLDAPRKAGYQMAQALSKAVGNNVHLFESVERGGKRVLAHDVGPYKAGNDAPNGWYDHSTGDIYVDINAGERGQGTILYTLSHEYTHFIRQWSPEKFETLAKFLFENADISIEAAIQNQMDKAARAGRDIDRDKAMEEVVADAMEAMLSDTNAAEKIIELRNRDKGLWEKLKELITKIRNAVRSAYKDFAPDSHEGLMLKRMDESLTEKLSTLFAEGVADAAENYSRANVTIDMATESVAPSNSLRTWTKSEYVQEREETAKKISKTLGVSMEKAYEYIDSINSVAKLIADDAVRLDYEPNLNESATALKPNSEYKYTVDMSTLCAKRLLFTGTFDAIQKALPNVAFDSDAIVHLRKMMMDRDYQVACGICYVESTRREIGTITKEFIERYKIAQQSGKPITRLNSEGKEVELQEKGTKRTFMAEEGYTPTLGELNTTDIDIVQRDHPDVYAAYLSFMNARGQAKPKLLETRTEYKGEILKSFNNKRAVASRNAAGGLRLQSFSDFEVPHLIDMMQVVMDMSRVGLMSQAYTKVPAFARAFGETCVKINLSLIAKGDGIDADGNLIFDDVEGINHEEAFAIREQHSKNVGTILVGKNSAHIRAAMADPRIDFIIPFHKSSWKESLYGALGLEGYQDYTVQQNEKPWDGNRKISNFAPSEYWDYSKSGDENAQIYLQKCREDGRYPKFPEFQDEPGYWKLLIDFKMYDNDGVGAPQQVVQPVFDDAVNAEILAEYKGGHQSYPVAQDVVDDFVREYKEGKVGGDNISLSNRTYSWKELTAKPPMEVAVIRPNLQVPMNADGTVNLNAFKNAVYAKCKSIQTNSSSPTYYLFAPDIGKNVKIVSDGILHVLGKNRKRKASTDRLDSLRATLVIDELLENAVVVNEDSSRASIDSPKTYIMLSAIRMYTTANQYSDYAVRLMVEDRVNQDPVLTEAKVLGFLHAANAKKIPASKVKGSNQIAAPRASQAKIFYNVADFITDVKDIYNDVFSKDVYSQFGQNRVPSKGVPHVDFSLRNQPTTDRYVLTNAEGLNDTEIRILAKYREESGRMAGLEDTLEAQRETLKELLASDIRDKDVLRAQREGIRATEARIGVEQGILKRMEESATLQRVLKRERENDILEGYERGRFDQGYETAPKTRREMERVASEEFLKGYERGRFDQGLTMAEQQRRAMEYAEKKTGDRINRLEVRLAEAEENERRRVQQLKNYRQNQGKKELLRKIGKTTKELNDWLAHPSKDKHIPSDLIGVVVEALDAVNMDTVNAEERLAILDRRIAEVDKSLSVTTEDRNRQRLEAAREKLVRQQNTISKQGYRMRENLSKLQSVYNAIRESDDPVLAGAYDENISAKIQEVWEAVGDTPIREMSVEQLQTVYDLYRMVSKTVRNANKAFRAGKTATVEGLANSVMNELGKKTARGDVRKFRLGLEKLVWSDLKPVYAFKTIGSDTMTELFNSVRAGEDTWAKDVSEAKAFYLREAEKHGMKSWNMDEKFTFTSTSGKDFELTLGDIMSIYAYSKREQALDHLAKGGIVLQPDMDKKGAFAKVSENATAYNLSPEILMEITGKLTAPQKAFVDAMQRYLSTDMGAKGNDVSMELYDVKLFNEENYFPLRSAKAYMPRAKEQAEAPVKIKNSGFTKAVTPNASNPIVMQPFMEVWSEHVNDMAMYHAFTLPLEDFYRVYNYGVRGDGEISAESVTATIQNIYGGAATKYIDTLLRDVNGGARVESSFGVVNRAFSKFKKAAVMASASVVVQQPTAIARAFAYIPANYFVGEKMTTENQMKVWDEVKKYAPIAVIKEIGSFDQNAGKRTVDWITQRKYDGFGEKAKAFVTDSDFRDDVLGYGAEKADQLTWCWIWQAAKRMVAQTTDLRGEALRQRAAEIFTEAIVNTQVYDSVMSRSQVMRSKSGLDQMITAFMGEPTTTLNMLYEAYVLEGARNGNYKRAAQLVGAVTSSVIVNALVKSVVTASRDDDDEKTWLEKYISDFASSSVGGLLRVDQLIPYARDIGNIVIDGYDVERSDVSIYNDLVQVVEKLWSVEESEEIAGAAVDVVATFANFFGIPGTNIIRELRAIENVYGMATGGEKNTMIGFENAIREGLIGGVSRRLDNRKANNQQLYEALMAGDTKQIERVTGRYETQKEADADVRKYLREADSRIAEAALARFEGRTAEYDRIINEIINEGKLDRNVVVGAVRAEEDKLKESNPSTEIKASSLYTANDLVKAMKDGEFPLAGRIKDDIVLVAQQNGKTANEAERDFKSDVSEATKAAYMNGSINSAKAKSILEKYAGKKSDDSADILKAWEFERINGWIYDDKGVEYKDGKITRNQLKTAMVSFGKMTSEEAELAAKAYDWQMDGVEGEYNSVLSMVKKYEEGGLKAAGISKDIWYKAYTGYNDTKGVDADGDGKTDAYSKVEGAMEKINALPITAEQKTLIAMQIWESKTTINNYKLW